MNQIMFVLLWLSAANMFSMDPGTEFTLKDFHAIPVNMRTILNSLNNSVAETVPYNYAPSFVKMNDLPQEIQDNIRKNPKISKLLGHITCQGSGWSVEFTPLTERMKIMKPDSTEQEGNYKVSNFDCPLIRLKRGDAIQKGDVLIKFPPLPDLTTQFEATLFAGEGQTIVLKCKRASEKGST